MVDPSLTRTSDGRLMCCICFKWLWPQECFLDANGDTWDICGTGPCAEQAGYVDGRWRNNEMTDDSTQRGPDA